MENRNPTKISPRVFISYSWTSPAHEDWVLNLAERLMSDGIAVTLDKWDLVEGQDTYVFMESMVRSEEINKVLIVCDSGYKKKSETRTGGVGTEAQILSPEVYNNVRQEKFIPIIAERDNEGNPFVPTFIKTRKYIDLSSENRFESEYETLLRNLASRPAFKKPPLGTLPSYLFEDEPSRLHKTTNINKMILDAANRNPNRVKTLVKEFMDEILKSLNEFRVAYQTNSKVPFDEEVLSSINKMLPLRDDFVTFIDIVSGAGGNEIDIEPFVNLFERLQVYTQPPAGQNQWNDLDFDNYRFFIHELFLYLIMNLLKHEKYELVSTILDTDYLYKDRFATGLVHSQYGLFYHYIRSLDELRRNRLHLNRVSVAADILIQRTDTTKFSSQKLVETDLLLYYIAALKTEPFTWFPKCYPYLRGDKIEILERMKSKRHFERVKVLFNVKNAEEFGQLITTHKTAFRGYNNSFSAVNAIETHISPEEVCSLS